VQASSWVQSGNAIYWLLFATLHASILAPLPRLHLEQSVRRFSSTFLPPRDQGWIWSTCSSTLPSLAGDAPQLTHRKLSRDKILYRKASGIDRGGGGSDSIPSLSVSLEGVGIGSLSSGADGLGSFTCLTKADSAERQPPQSALASPFDKLEQICFPGKAFRPRWGTEKGASMYRKGTGETGGDGDATAVVREQECSE
jgi:hypothetical protein